MREIFLVFLGDYAKIFSFKHCYMYQHHTDIWGEGYYTNFLHLLIFPFFKIIKTLLAC